MSRASRREQPAAREELPARVVVEWPGGPYDFALVPQSADWLRAEAKPGWYLVTGWVVEPEGVQHRTMRTLYAERVDETTFRMMPARPRPVHPGVR